MKKYYGLPPERIKYILHGNRPPDGFEGNGCILSPTLWFREACRIHDWEYERIIKDFRNGIITKNELAIMRRRADKNLKKNIRILSTMSIDPNGYVIRKPYRWYHYIGYRLAKTYYRIVRLFGIAFAK